MNKKVYIAARAKYRRAQVAEIQAKLTAMGYTIAYDWPASDSKVKKPYRLAQNRRQNLPVQSKMLRAAAKADIFIFLDDPGLRGAYIELGAFLADCLDNSQGRRAYIVGPDSNDREFIFESPEYVVLADSMDQVYGDLAGLHRS